MQVQQVVKIDYGRRHSHLFGMFVRGVQLFGEWLFQYHFPIRLLTGENELRWGLTVSARFIFSLHWQTSPACGKWLFSFPHFLSCYQIFLRKHVHIHDHISVWMYCFFFSCFSARLIILILRHSSQNWLCCMCLASIALISFDQTDLVGDLCLRAGLHLTT